MDTKEFLTLLHGDDRINFRVINEKDNPINFRGKYDDETISKIKKYNEQGFNIYFVVNSGGTHAHEINKINAVFVDFDCGRDEKKEYYSLEETRKYKVECIRKLDEFSIEPSFIVQTRNGVHAYWLVDNSATTDQFLECQKRLISYFDSDTAIKELSRIMRLPGYNWTKDINNPFMCTIIERNNSRYDIEYILEQLPNVDNSRDISTTKRKYNKSTVSLSGTLYPSDSRIRQLKEKDLIYLKAYVKPKPVKFNNYDDVYDYLKKQDLCLFLGLPKRFNCIFHEDNNPSANIYKDPETGYYWYKCFSPKCEVLKDIISITQSLLKCSKPDALNFLRKVYDIQFEETEWQKQTKEGLDLNIELLSNEQRLKELVPETYGRIKYYLEDIMKIICFARDKVITENFTDAQGNPIFFASLDFLAQKCGIRDRKKINKIITILTYLGLLNKLKEEDIPEFLLKESKHQAALKKHENIVGYYSIPYYSDEILDLSETRAKRFIEKGLNMKGLSREIIFRLLGEEEADRVFPQLKGKKISKASGNFYQEVVQAVMKLINYQGYATESQVLMILPKDSEFNKIKLKRVIGQIIAEYKLTNVKANKILKEKLDIESKGYPNIILMSEDYESIVRQDSKDINEAIINAISTQKIKEIM